MKIRFWRDGDDTEWLRMRRALWPEVPLDAHRTEMGAWRKRSDAVILVAARAADTGLAGFAEVGARSVAEGCDTSPVGYLEGWYVDPDVRRQGIGAALLQAAESWAREQGYREFASDAELDNDGSQRTHLALGFTEVGRSVLYRKAL